MILLSDKVQFISTQTAKFASFFRFEVSQDGWQKDILPLVTVNRFAMN